MRGVVFPLLALLLTSSPNRAIAANAQDTITFYGELTNQATDIPVTGNLDVFVRVFSSPNGGSALWD